jgi:hypothetical protein
VERKVLDLLNELMIENPFCDVCFVGHSFGGSLATIAAVNCAETNPMMTISCHTFGTPKIGNLSFKERAHSLPNLRLFRVENGSDWCVNTPSASAFHHVGHAIVISSRNNDRSATRRRSSTSQKEQIYAQAFKFGKKEKEVQPILIHSYLKKSSQERNDHEMRSYLHAIESFTHQGCQWVRNFVGEDGEGILANKEERVIV